MGLSTAMEIGKNGLNVYRIAQEVTGENIANVNTPGYSRQRVILETAPPISSNGFPLGTGVHISSVERYYDKLLQQQLVNAQTTLGHDSTKSSVLQQVEPAFNEVAQDGLGAAISNYFGAWQDLTLNPAGSAERQAVLSRAQILADNFHAVSTSLNSTISIQNDTLVPLTDDINAKLKNIAQLNGQIRTTELVSGNANEIRDQRDLLVRDLSQQIGITYTENPDGSTDINYPDGGNVALVTGSAAGSFTLTTTAGNFLSDGVTLKNIVNVTPAGSAVAAPVTPKTGQLGAVMYLRDDTTGGIPSYLAQVNTLAKTIIDEVNAVHITGFQQDSVAAGANFFTGTTAAGMTVNLTTTTQIAASGVSGLIGDNSNALKLAQLQNKLAMPGGTATFNSYFSSLVSKIGLDVQSAKNTEAQDISFTKQLTTLRESNSGVSLDEELTNLIKYQRSYQASAKLITTATEMMDIVINLIR